MRPRTLMYVLAALSLASLVVWVMSAAAAERGPAGTRSDVARPGGPSQPGRRSEPGTLVVGQPAPDFELPRLTIEKDKDGNLVGKVSQEKVKLSSLRGKKPVCLFLSSYTWPPFRSVVPAIEALYVAYKDKVDFFLVYVREAHPVDARPGQEGRPGNPSRGDPDIKQARSIDDRTVAATQCVANMKLSLPLLLDNMEGTTEKAYGGWPAATAIVDVDGKICFQSHGPSGARPKEAEGILKQLLANGGRFTGEAPAAAAAEKPTEKRSPPAQQPATPPKGRT